LGQYSKTRIAAPNGTPSERLFPNKKNRKFNKTMLIRKCPFHALRVGEAGAGLKKRPLRTLLEKSKLIPKMP
jgi:hypothetical protein